MRELRRLPGDTPVYYYVKTRQSNPDDASVEEEILFPRKRNTDAGVLLMMKPSSLGAGLATKTLGALATGT